MPFLDMTIYSNTLHLSDISLNRDLVNELDLITDLDLVTKFRDISIEYLQRLRQANGERLLLLTPGTVLSGTFF